MSRRVVISGVGTVTGFGYGADALWDGLVSGRSCLRRVSRFDPSGLHCQIAAEVRDFSARDHVPKSYRKAVKVMARDIELAVAAAKAAVESAGIQTKGTLADESATPTFKPARVGCQIGAGLIAAELTELTMALATSTDADGRFSYSRWGTEGMDNLTPLWLLKYLPNMLSCHVTIIHEACGPSNTITCGEASGALSIGESMRVIQRGDADLCFSGGAESKVNAMGMVRLEYAQRLGPVSAEAGRDDEVWRTVRPFDPEARGGAVGEGAGIVLLEDRESAIQRGATVFAEALGFGAGHSPRSKDAQVRSEGLVAAIESALEDAEVSPNDIDVIVPQGWGAPASDLEEIAALRQVFGPRLADIPMVTMGPAIGNAVAGQGGVAACVAAMCLKRQTLPARLNAGRPPEDIQAGAAESRDARMGRALVCTPSIGGQNAAIVLGAV